VVSHLYLYLDLSCQSSFSTQLKLIHLLERLTYNLFYNISYAILVQQRLGHMAGSVAPAPRWRHYGCLQFFRSQLRRGRRSSKSRQEPAPEPLTRLPTFRVGTKCAQTQSDLLSMPAEIRILIWEYVVASDPIILYQKTGQITYDYLMGEGPEVVHNISPQTLTHIERTHSISQKHTTKNIRLLAVLQTCQMM
jgi:hypothetical protein